MASIARSNDALERAAAILEERFDPDAVLVFGSHASGRDTDLSDIDLAIIARSTPPDAFAVAGACTDLEAELGRPVDLVVLNGASPILRMEILRRHRMLRNRDPELWEAFCVRTLREYFDLKRVRAPIERALLRGPR